MLSELSEPPLCNNNCSDRHSDVETSDLIFGSSKSIDQASDDANLGTPRADLNSEKNSSDITKNFSDNGELTKNDVYNSVIEFALLKEHFDSKIQFDNNNLVVKWVKKFEHDDDESLEIQIKVPDIYYYDGFSHGFNLENHIRSIDVQFNTDNKLFTSLNVYSLMLEIFKKCIKQSSSHFYHMPLYYIIRELNDYLVDLHQQNSSIKSDVWTEDEKLQLSKALLWYKAVKDPIVKWRKVSEYVKTKSPKQSYLKYVELWQSHQKQKDSKDFSSSDVAIEKVHPAKAPEKSTAVKPAIEFNFAEYGFTFEADVSMYNCYSYIVKEINLILVCNKCKLSNKHHLTFDVVNYGTISKEFECSSCKQQCICYAANKLCTSQDKQILNLYYCNACPVIFSQIVFHVLCESCSKPVHITVLINNKTEVNCHTCNAAMVFQVNNPTFVRPKNPLLVKTQAKKIKSKKIQLNKGEPLPNNGACSHFKKSFKYFVWNCCKIPYACPICHDNANDHNAEGSASKIICGFCSKIHKAHVSECDCGSSFTAKVTTHWEGGKGCRNQITMSRKDRHKYKNMNKSSTTAKK